MSSGWMATVPAMRRTIDHMTSHRHHRYWITRQRGFTLVEAIVVMVITGILAGIMVLFIRRPVQNYTDAAARAELSDAADLALRRMARELRSALPNSVRLTVVGNVWWLEFIPTVSGGKYLAMEDNPGNAASPLSFSNLVAAPFNVIGSMPALAQTGPSYIAIYNLGPGFVNADAYNRDNLALVTGMDDINRRISYESAAAGEAANNGKNPYAIAPQNPSPDQRFQVVTSPVTFRCEGQANGKGTLTRFVSANFFSAQPQPTAAAGSMLANNVVACNFSIGTPANRQSALVGLTLVLGRANPDAANALETVTLTHQIHVDNTP